MTLLLTTLIILTCALLVIIVLVQNPKGGGLSSTFGGGGGGTQLFGGVKKTTDFLDRGTWALAIALVVLVMASNIVLKPEVESGEVRESSLEAVDVDQPVNTPAAQQIDFPIENANQGAIPPDDENQ